MVNPWMVLEVEGPVEQEDDLEGDKEIDVTPEIA